MLSNTGAIPTNEYGRHSTGRVVAPGKPPQWTALLLASRQLHDEAGWVLYGLNHFNLVDTAVKREAAVIESYLTSIGPTNASFLSHICIGYPVDDAVDGQTGERLSGESKGLRTWQLIRENWNNLTTLEAYVHRGNSKALVQSNIHGGPYLFPDGQLNAIPSLTKFVVRFYDGPPARSAH